LNSPVAITGVGIVSALGSSRGEVVASLRDGKRPFAPVRQFDASAFRVDLAAEAVELDAAGRFGRPALRRTSRTDRMAAWAIADAVDHAELRRTDLTNAGLYFGASSAGMAEMEASFASGRGPGFWEFWTYPIWTTTNGIARELGIGGVRSTFMTACSSSAHALGVAMRRIRSGTEEIALAGGAEALCRLTLSGFGSLGVLDPDGARPFDAARAGITLGEGAAFLVLEAPERAERRGVRPLAFLAGYGGAAEAHHMVHPLEDGSGAVRTMRAALDDARVAASEIDYVNAHGTGTIQNDAMEARALADLLPDGVRVASSKGMLGHALGAAGALEAALTVLGMAERCCPPCPGVGDPAPEVGSLRVVREAGDRAPHVALSSSFAFGGNNAAVVLLHPETEAAKRLGERAEAQPVSILVTAGAVAAPRGTASDPETLAGLLDGDPEEGRDLAGLEPAAVLGPNTIRRMDPLSAATAALFSMVAEQADLERMHDVATCFGTSFGALDATAKFLERLFGKGPHLVNPLEFPNLVHNAPAGNAGIRLGARGISVTTSQEDLAGDDAALVMLDLMRDGDAAAALVGGGDLASEWLDRGYAAVDRLVGTSSRHASVVGAILLERQGARTGRSGPWARILGTGASGPAAAVAGAVARAVEAAAQAGLRVDSIDVWLRGATERRGEAHESRARAHPLLSETPAIDARRILGDAGGAGIAVLALAAAAIRVGRARTALVTSVTRDGSARAILLGEPT
jgi:3-oxoacyl-[acyl-carrier-protein] synthase II